MKKELNVQIGLRVRKAREDMGLSREQLAELVDVSALFLSYIECGQRGMSLETLISLCSALGVSADDILLGNQRPCEDQLEEAQRILRDMPAQYLPLAVDMLHTLQRTIATVRAQPAPDDTSDDNTRPKGNLSK